MKRVLLTGGLGYLGSHTALALNNAGFSLVLLDNLMNSNQEVISHLETITGTKPLFIAGDVRDTDLVERILKINQVDSVIHFAGLKVAGESLNDPLSYYANNVVGTVSLLQAMKKAGTHSLVFSSSAAVYGDPSYVPIDEDHPLSATSPYGKTKLHIEEMLYDLACSDPCWRIANLRYFNPAGNHNSGLIGDNPMGIPSNLVPYIANVAIGNLPFLNVYGADYDTPDGTGIRDYIHVMDLAEGHRAALEFLDIESGWHPFNLGIGQGYSVLDMVHAFEATSGKRIPIKIAPRRLGDVAKCYSNPGKAQRTLNWQAKRGIEEICTSAWLFHQRP